MNDPLIKLYELWYKTYCCFLIYLLIEADVPVSNMIQISSTPPSTTSTTASTTTAAASKAGSTSSSSTINSEEKPKATDPLKPKTTEKSTLKPKTTEKSTLKPKTTAKAKTAGFHPTIEKEEDPFKPVLSEKQLDSNTKFGQISGVSVKSDGTVVVFHRGERKWDYK